jgi:hypothetical protein
MVPDRNVTIKTDHFLIEVVSAVGHIGGTCHSAP